MHMPDLRHAIANRQAQSSKAGLVVFGVSVFALSLVGAWFSLRPSATQFTFTPYSSPRPIANVEFEDGNGQKRTLADFKGKVVLLNIWATWCGPCREEMPTLDRLQQRLGSTDFEVVALSIDRGGQAAVRSFLDHIKVQRLAIYVDASAEAHAKLGAVGIPTTLLLDREGREIGRVVGPAEWDRPEVIATIQRYLPARPP
ncbi:MAG: TlpA disulfide reductase family protein [Betaproteobacteria bacterium]